MSDNTILNSCDYSVLTMEDAKRPIITVLLPVKGLRRDMSGNLTDDAVKTVLEGVKSLGIQVDSNSTTDALLQEAKSVLCKMNKQYEFLLAAMFTAVSRSEKLDMDLMNTLKAKTQDMQDVLSVSRQVLNKPPSKDKKEGFVGNQESLSMAKYREAFQGASNTVADRAAKLNTSNLMDLRTHSIELTEDNNRYASHLLNLYSFLNIVAVGFILYIVSK
jgi:hypothetical protein